MSEFWEAAGVLMAPVALLSGSPVNAIRGVRQEASASRKERYERMTRAEQEIVRLDANLYAPERHCEGRETQLAKIRVEIKELRQIVQDIRVVVTSYAGCGSHETDTDNEKMIFGHLNEFTPQFLSTPPSLLGQNGPKRGQNSPQTRHKHAKKSRKSLKSLTLTSEGGGPPLNHPQISPNIGPQSRKYRPSPRFRIGAQRLKN